VLYAIEIQKNRALSGCNANLNTSGPSAKMLTRPHSTTKSFPADQISGGSSVRSFHVVFVSAPVQIRAPGRR
jgi:hypothetical protein